MRKATVLVLSLIAASQLSANAVATPPAAAQPELGAMPSDATPAPVGPNAYLAQAGAALQAEPNATNFAQFMNVLKTMLAAPGMNKTPAAAIIKTNPVLTQLGVKIVEAGAGRIWTFPRINFSKEVIAQ